MADRFQAFRKVADAANDARCAMPESHLEVYTRPNAPGGMFVGEHTGFVVVPHETLSAMLDVVEAADTAMSVPLDDPKAGVAADVELAERLETLRSTFDG